MVVALGVLACTHVEPLTNAYAPWFAKAVGDRCAEFAEDGQCSLYDVSLVELIAVPEKFHDKNVRVIGFVQLTFEGNVICLSREVASPNDCIFLDIEGIADPGFREGEAILQGHFDGELRGHLGCCSGTIDHISRLERRR